MACYLGVLRFSLESTTRTDLLVDTDNDTSEKKKPCVWWVAALAGDGNYRRRWGRRDGNGDGNDTFALLLAERTTKSFRSLLVLVEFGRGEGGRDKVGD